MTLEQPELPPSEADSRPLLTAGSAPLRRSRRWLWVAVGVGVAFAAWLAFRGSGRKGDRSVASPGAKGASRTIPVTAVPAAAGNLAVYLNGLGTVTALNTVTVRTRVDGQLVDVAFREGQIVRRGDLLARIDPRPFEVQLAQAEGQKAKDRAALENARVDLKRYEVLAAQDAIPRQQLDTQVATVHQDEASVASDQGQVDAAKLNLTYSRITAPIGGRVGLRLVDPGNIVHAGDANGLLVITQLEPIAAVFTIPSDQLPPVLAKKRAGDSLEVDAWDREMKTKLAAGTLSAIDNQIDTSTGTVKLKAEFPNSDGALFPNQFVNARLLLDTLRNTTLVPAAAVQRSSESTFVWVVRPDSSVEMRPVQVVWTEGDETAVSRGLAPGEPVVVEGIDNLQPGAKVAVVRPGAPAPAAKAAPPAGRGKK
ncbi:MAG TPA: MdtA/MuxA family multidrug efflux RND transporter periplasmic adaptor subunit [Thermoanaerobaculia bacterium]|nr:MdtA/MuxA family multidrug efflux RND transporter periplasmic adaptor subunit [Thermoanaerobaculia bacterium]